MVEHGEKTQSSLKVQQASGLWWTWRLGSSKDVDALTPHGSKGIQAPTSL